MTPEDRRHLTGMFETIIEEAQTDREPTWLTHLREDIYAYAENLDDPDGLERGIICTMREEHRARLSEVSLPELLSIMNEVANPKDPTLKTWICDACGKKVAQVVPREDIPLQGTRAGETALICRKCNDEGIA